VTELGQITLLVAFVAAGFSAFCSLVGWRQDHRALGRCGVISAVVSVSALSAATALLVWALAARDFHFAYVAHNASRGLPWYYAVSALWVGQAGSLLLWAWLTGLVTLAYRLLAGRDAGYPSAGALAELAFAVAMTYVAFLLAVMIFAADPMEPSLGSPGDGLGLSPVLQHPAMLIHPPVVFLGYACWTIPFVLAAAALATGQLDARWARQARPWALGGWIALGGGILFGAEWAYEELGWGGYWAWDPVENASLIPWLCGTAFLHASMGWRQAGGLKKTTLLLAVATFGLCNFAAFLTRSGLFSSLHAFSRSPIGWMFLVLMAGLVVAGIAIVAVRRAALRPKGPIASIWARESLVLISCLALLLLAGVVLLGTLAAPLTGILGRKIVVGAALYNNALIPIGLLLVAATALAPLVRWSKAPGGARKTTLWISLAAGCVAAAVAWGAGVRQPIVLAVAGLATLAVAAFAGALVLDVRQRLDRGPWRATLRALRDGRRQYAGFVVHMGFACLAAGVAGSSLCSSRCETALREGEEIQWQGRSIRLAGLTQRIRPDRLTAEVQVDVSAPGSPTYTIRPAHHLRQPQNEWTTEVAIHSTWAEDFYAILHSREPSGAVNLTLLVNPMMRWIWLGGWVAGLGAALALMPLRWLGGTGVSPVPRRSTRETPVPTAVAPPHWAVTNQQSTQTTSRAAVEDRHSCLSNRTDKNVRPPVK
jgi:cytochrome c-type biogenesis protein CcmF